MFADTATIEIRAGKGGDGASSFRHEKYRALGGPDGGDGGKGGDVVFSVDHNLNTLSRYRTVRHIEAEDGQAGGSNRMRGKGGADIEVKLPRGTQVWDGDNLLVDLDSPGQTTIIARGGRGGFGNAHFKSSVRQAPQVAELGEPGQSLKLRLELKLVADVGLIGLPNAGKSTLLSVISNAKPEIGDYAFTTLVPNLGVVEHRDYAFLVADIPGLIEGASAGKGLGDEFLRHVTRTALLLHLIDVASPDPIADYQVIQHELHEYENGLSQKPQIIVLTKQENTEADQLAKVTKAMKKVASGASIFAISAQTHQGLTPLLDAVVTSVKEVRNARAETEDELPVITETAFPDLWHVEPDGPNTWRVSGERIEGFAKRTNFDAPEALARLHDILRRTGVSRELRRQGAVSGDTVFIGEAKLTWGE